ncbi:MAG: methyltransferase domain-containing protein [Tunicatimonas sp.]
MNATCWNPTLYNQKHSFVYQYGESLVDELNPQPNEHILDLGCGTGELTQRISTFGACATGIDSSAALIATAQQRFPSIEFRQQDAAQLSDTECYDAIFSNAVLHWVEDQAALTRGLFQALRPGGRLVAEFGGQGNVQKIVNPLRETLHQHGYETQAAAQPWYFPSVGQYASLLESHGFEVQWMHHYDRPTELNDTTDGIVDWLRMFAGSFLARIATDKQNIILEEVQEKLRTVLYREGKWYADYQRLRVRAVRPL